MVGFLLAGARTLGESDLEHLLCQDDGDSRRMHGGVSRDPVFEAASRTVLIQMCGGIGAMTDKDDYWFPAKTLGWGWGLPITWQGWVVYGVAAVLVVCGHFFFPPQTHTGFFLAYIWIVVLALVAVCWLKGEPPRWRWRKQAAITHCRCNAAACHGHEPSGAVMRVVARTLLATMLALSTACASIPLSTALGLSSMSPRALAQLDPAQVLVRISVPEGFEIDVPGSHLRLSLTAPSGTHSVDMDLALLGLSEGSRSTGLFGSDISVSTYLLALGPDGVHQLQQLQRKVLVGDAKSFEFSVTAQFSKVPRNPTRVTLWTDLKLSSSGPFMRLMDGATIEFEHSADRS